MILIVFYFFIFIMISSCSSRFVVNNDKAVKTDSAILQIDAIWIKDKGDKYDIRIMLKNKSEEKNIIITVHELACYKGDIKGKLNYTFFNTGERNIDLSLGEAKEFNIVCNLGRKIKGDYQLKIDRVYDNVSGDGKSKDKILEKDITWSYPEK